MRNSFIFVLLAALFLSSCGEKAKKPPYDLEQGTTASFSVPYEEIGGVKTIPVKLNGITMNMVYDTGCSGVSLSLNEVQTLLKNGKLGLDDILNSWKLTISGK